MILMRKTKPTDLAKLLTKYIFEYLPDQRGLSENTISSYTDSITIFFDFCETERNLKREKMEVNDIDCELVEDFYVWLEKTKGNSSSTRNQRRIAINAFFKYIQYQNPGYVLQSQQIRSIPNKVDRRQTIKHLPLAAVEEILKQPDLRTQSGRRDFIILSLMYESAARVSEIANLCIGDMRFEKDGGTLHLLGKGRKNRVVPIIAMVTNLLREYLKEEETHRQCQKSNTMFCNRVKKPLTRAGITYILHKYADSARANAPELIPEQIYPHILRHSRAMHWLEAGFDLHYIKDLLGHADITTTEIYARLSVEMKRKLLEKTNPVMSQPVEYPSWTEDKSLVDWLESFRDS